MKTSRCTRITWWSIWWYRSIYLCSLLIWYIFTNEWSLWNWVWGTDQDPNSGNIKNLIIDDYENNPSWKQNRYKTFQIGNHTLEEVEIRCSISVILYFLAYIITLMVSQMKYQLLKMVVQQENLEHQLKHINLLQKMLVQWCIDNNNLLK